MHIFILIFSFFLTSTFAYAGDDDETSEPVIEYIEMTPKFTVNLDKPNKYLAVSVQLMVEGEKFIEKVKKTFTCIKA